MDVSEQYRDASQKTAELLKDIAQSPTVQTLSRLTLPEIEALVDQIARMVPAGNIPALILSGLLRLPGRKLSARTAQKDINLLFTGVTRTLDKTVYGAFFAGPAAVIWGYQKLLSLAGIDPDDAFPEGLWQFYVDYAMREDTARHTNETHGFDTFLNQSQIQLNPVDRITAWAITAIHCLHQYDALLTNEWRERVHLQLLAETVRLEPNLTAYTRLYHAWEKERPYGLGADAAAGESYPAYRRRRFDQFLAAATDSLPVAVRHDWLERIHQAEAESLPAYRRQLSILAHLDPGPYGETRTPLSLEEARIGVIYRGCIYLIPICQAGTDQPPEVQVVRAQVAAIVANPIDPPAQLPPLAEIRRSAWPGLGNELSLPLQEKLKMFQQMPILLNCNPRSRHLSLAEVRQVERGRGDQALTLFDTGQTIVFDQSHIFFDAVWGMALSEIMTQQAITWAKHLTTLESLPGPASNPPPALIPPATGADLETLRQAPHTAAEVSAETDLIDMEAIRRLRRHFKQRHDLLKLTINDLLLLYRAIHAATYRPAPNLIETLEQLTQNRTIRPVALAALETLQPNKRLNPSLVMPVDASRRSPRDRLSPITFEVPLNELKLLDLHEQTLAALTAYQQAAEDDQNIYADFDHLRRTYLARLAAFAELMSTIKQVAATGESFSLNTMKLLAHIPLPLQHLLQKIPDSIDLLNDLTRGRENFSNVGAVAPDSSLTRFISAKDDNDKKSLIWGVMTDAQGVMHLTLRDFRPHVGHLIAAGNKALATLITRHYLESYARGLNTYVNQLHQVTQISDPSRRREMEKSRA